MSNGLNNMLHHIITMSHLLVILVKGQTSDSFVSNSLCIFHENHCIFHPQNNACFLTTNPTNPTKVCYVIKQILF